MPSAHAWIAIGAAVFVAIVSFRMFFPRKGSFARDLDTSCKDSWYGCWRIGNFDGTLSDLVFFFWLGFAVLCGAATYYVLQHGIQKFFN